MKVGDIVEVTWRDACGYVNVDVSKAVVDVAVNIGYLVSADDGTIVLQSGRYDDGTGDFTVIPRAWTDKVTVIKRKGRK